MEGGPRLPEDVFMEYKARRAAVLKALTTEVEKFYQECDPEKENLCLYGHTDGTWEVTLPVEEVPPELPEPALGINFARNGMNEKDWLALVAVHSDAWLLGVSFYFGARFGFDRDARKLLFNMINSLPTIFEVVTGLANDSSNGNGTNKKRPKDRVSNGNGNGKANKSSSKGGHGNKPPMRGPPKEEEEESEGEEEEREDVNGEGNGGENGEESEEEEHGGNALCGACGNNNGQDQFWICCDVCEQWFHGKCVKITPARAEHIKHYKCPSCSNKRARAN